jgi:hypothetical protein
MDSNRFKRNVLRTVSARVTKFGLRNTARATVNAHVFHAIAGLNTEVGALIQGMQPFLLGFQLNQDILQNAFMSLGGVSYYTMLLSKVLKVKVPGSGKKLHLINLTKTEALLKLHEVSLELSYQGMSVFHGEAIDLEVIKDLTQALIGIIWPLTYDLFKVTPSFVFEDYSNRLSAGFPAGLFSDDQEEFKVALGNLKEQEAVLLATNNKKSAIIEPETEISADPELNAA